MKKLDELLNIGNNDVEDDDFLIIKSDNTDHIENIDQKVIELLQLDDYVEQMDKIAVMALQSYKDVIELAKNVDEKMAAELFNAAFRFQKNSLDALKQKNTAKVKAAEILQKKKLSDEEGLVTPEEEKSKNGNFFGDRNDLLKQINNSSEK